MIRIARNISRNVSTNISRTIGTEPDLVLDSYGGASVAYSLYDLGNQRGTVVESEGTYHNPVVRLRRDSDGTHKSFSGVEIGNNTALSWVNEDVVTYASDFSAGVDGNAAKSGTLTGNVDGIGSEDDNLSLWADGTSTSHGITLPQGSLVSGNQYTVTFDVYIPSGQTTVDGAGLYFAGTSTVTASTSTTDAWVTISDTFVYGTGFETGTMRVTQLDTGTGTPYVFTGANSASDDLIYIRNLTITQLTSNAYAATWYDQSGVGVVSVGINSSDDSHFSGASTNWSVGTLDTDNNELDLSLGAFATTSLSSANCILPSNGDSVVYEITITNYVSGSIKLRSQGASSDRDMTVDLSANGTYQGGKTFTDDWATGVQFIAGGSGFVGSIAVVSYNIVNKLHNDATQATEASQPKVVASGSYVVDANGNYSLSFDGTDDWLATLDGWVNNIQNCLLIAVIDTNDSSTGHVWYNSGAPDRLWMRTNAGGFAVGDPADTGVVAVTDNVVTILTAEGSAGAYSFRKDGVSFDTATTDETGGGTSGFIGSQNTGAGNWSGEISAILVYDTDKSSDRSAIEESLSDTITTALS